MGGDRIRRLESLFHEALAHSPDDRDRYLQHACGDDEDLRRDVRSLLDHEARATRFLESPAAFP